MATRIDVTPDLASLKKTFSDLRQEAERTQASINEATDTTQAAQNLRKLEDSMKSLKKAMTSVKDGAGLDIDVSEAEKSVEGLAKKIREIRTGQTASGDATLSRRALQDEEKLHQRRKTHIEIERALRRRVSEEQARFAERSFANMRRAHPHLSQFSSLGDFFERGQSVYGRDYQRIHGQVLSHTQRGAGIARAGIAGGLLSGTSLQRAGRLAGVAGGAIGGMIGGGGGGMLGSAGSLAGAGLGAAAGLIPGAGLILGPLIGTLAGSALGGLGQKLDQAMSKAIQEGMQHAQLTRAFGAAAAGFNEVKDAARDAARGMNITYADSAAQAAVFARAGALRSPQGLGAELAHAYGFGRSIGVEAGASVDMFARLRATGASSDEKQSRRIGLAVAEAIHRGGLGPQANEVLSAISGFAQTSTQTALRAPDVTGFAAMLSESGRLGLAGLTAANAAGIISRADAAIRGGGAFGQASQIVTREALSQLDPSLSVFELERLQQGGLFATLRSTFGPDSAAYKAADEATRRRYEQIVAGGNADTRVLDAILSGGMLSLYGSGDEQVAAIANQFGLSMDQADVLRRSAQSGGIGRLHSHLQSLGINPDNANLDAISTMAEIFTGSDEDRQKIARKMLAGDGFAKMGAEDRIELERAIMKGDAELRDTLLKMADKIGGPMSVADRALQTQISMENALTRMADSLIPATDTMRSGILALVEKMAPDTALGRRLHDQAALDREGSPANLDTLYDFDAEIARAKASGNRKRARELKRQRDRYRKSGELPNTGGASGSWDVPMPTPNTGGASGGWGDPVPPPSVSPTETIPAPSVGSTGGGGGGVRAPTLYPELDGRMLGQGQPHVLAFVEEYRDLAEAVAERLGVAPHVILGQWAQETGWGKSIIPGTANLGNIKDPDGNGPRAYDKREGSYDSYRAFGSVDEFADYYVDFVGRDRYKAGIGSGADARAFYTALKRGGYATDPNYIENTTATAATALRAMTPRHETAAVEEMGPTRQELTGNVKLDITVRDADGRPRDDVDVQVSGAQYEAKPAGVP